MSWVRLGFNIRAIISYILWPPFWSEEAKLTYKNSVCLNLVQFSSVMFDSLQSHELQHARPPCPSPTPRVHPNPCHWVGDAIQPSHPLSSPSPHALNLSQHQGLCSNESILCIRWRKYWSFSVSIRPTNEHPGLISFRMDWLDLLAVQGTLKSLLQYHSSEASILRHSAFFIVQLSHPYLTTGKTIALTRRTFVDKVLSLLFNMLSRLVITFFPRSKHLLISWLKSPSAVILEPPPKSQPLFPIYLPWNDGTGCHDLSFLNVEL